MSTSYYRAIAPSLPTELAIQLDEELLCQQKPTTEPILDALIRFVCGAGCPDTLSESVRTQWPEKQRAAKEALYSLFPSSLDLKRPRDGDWETTSDAKRQRLTPSSSDRDASQDGQTTAVEDAGQPILTLHAISATSPIRKKVDITVHEHALRFTNLGTHSVEALVPLSSLRRAFLLPTRGKNKAHWTIVLISSDTPDRGKPNSSSAQTYPQVIFGVDAIASSVFTTTTYASGVNPTAATVAKGGTTLPSLKAFLSHLGIQVLEPTADVFKSACSGYGANAGQGGVPGVEAYRAAKVGSLWFMKEGILWGESKPCEFWAVGDLLGKSEGLRVLAHPGGRTCTITLTRKSSEEDPEDGEDFGTESAFTMIDSREQQGINQWVRAHRHLFGKKKDAGGDATTSGENKTKLPAEEMSYRGPVTIHQIGDESDEGDEDFEMDSSDESDEGSSSSSEERKSDEEESGAEENSDEEGEESGDADGERAEEEEEEELREENHPLLRPGAVPRMSKAAMEMVIDLTTEEFLGSAGPGNSEEEEDELEE